VAEIIREIKEKTGEGGRDFGLFLPPNPVIKQHGLWLERNRALRYYSIKNDSRLEYKKRHRPLSVRTADDAEKKVLVDDSALVRAICDTVGDKLGLGKHAEQFCLAFPGSTQRAPKWLLENQTMHEQGVEPGCTLEFLKRYSVLDSEVAANDAHILHLLYVTTVKQIVGEVYPITRNDARDFASLQLQVTYGDHNSEKHKPGFADLTTMVPAPFLNIKPKEEQKKFFAEIYRDHKKLKGCKDNVAKQRYIQLARSLKTYGFTFYHSQLQTEKVEVKRSLLGKKQEQLVKQLQKVTFGISLSFFCLYDADTNQFTQKIPFTEMKAWNAVGDVCTIDFLMSTKDGNQEVVYTLITPEAEPIVATIAGYINIILKIRKDKAAVITNSSGEIGEVSEGDEEWGKSDMTLMSSYRNPNAFGAGQGTFMGAGGPGGQGAGTGPENAKSINVNSMPSAMRAAKMLSNDLATGKGAWGKMGALTEENWQKQFDHNKTQLLNDFNDFLGALQTGGAKLDRRQLDAKATNMHMNLVNLSTAARNLAALNEDKAPLLNGAKALCDSLADLMGLVMNNDVEGGEGPSLQDILQATQKQFAAAFYLTSCQVSGYVDEGTKILLLECIGDVDAHMQMVTKTIRKECEGDKFDAATKAALEMECKKADAIKGVALSTMASLAPHLGDPQALVHIHYAKSTINDLCGALEAKYKVACGGSPLANAPVLTHIQDVETALKNLFEAAKAKEAKGVAGNLDIVSPAVELLHSLAGLRAGVRARDPYQMNGATQLCQDYNKTLVEAIRVLAPQVPALQVALERSADHCEADTNAIAHEAKLLQADPTNLACCEKLLAHVGTLESCVQQLISDVGQTTAINNLRFHSKNVASNMVRLATASRVASDHTDDDTKTNLTATSADISKQLTSLLNLLQIASGSPDNILAQQALQEGVQKQFPKYQGFIQASNNAAPKLTNTDVQAGFTATTNNAALALDELAKTVQRIDDMHGNLLIAQALSAMDLVRADLETATCFAEQGILEASHNVSLQQALEKLVPAIAKAKQTSQDVLASAQKGQKSVWPDQVLASSQALQKVSELAILTARALPTDRLAQTGVLAAATKALQDQRDLIAASRQLVNDPKSAPKLKVAGECQDVLSNHLDQIVSSAKGFNPENIEQAQKLLASIRADLEKAPYLESDLAKQHAEAAKKLKNVAKAVTLPCATFNDTAKTTPNQIGYDAKLVTASVGQLLSLAHVLAYTDSKMKDDILAAAKLLADQMALLLRSTTDIALHTPGATAKSEAIVADLLKGVDTLRATVKSAPSASVDHAINQIMAALTDQDSSPVALTRPEILDQLKQGTSELEGLINVFAALPSAENPTLSNHGTVSAKMATSLETLLAAAHAAEASDGSKPVMSLAGARLLQGCDLIIANPKDEKLASTVLSLAASELGPALMAETRQAVITQADPAQRTQIVAAQQDFQKALATAVANNKNTKQTPDALKADVTVVRAKLVELQAVVNDHQHSPEILVGPVLGKQVLASTKALAEPATTTIRVSSLLSATAAKNDPLRNELGTNVKAMQKSLADLNAIVKDLDRSTEEAKKTIQILQKASADLDTALLFVTIGSLEVAGADKTKVQEAQAKTKDTAREVADLIKLMVSSVKTGKPSELLAASVGLQHTIPLLVDQLTIVGASLDDKTIAQQLFVDAKQFVNTLKDLTDCTLKVDKAKPATLQPFAMNAGKTTQELAKILALLNTGVNAQNQLDKTIAALEAGLGDLRKPLQSTDNFDTCNQKLAQNAKQIGLDVAALLKAESEAQILAAAEKIGVSGVALLESARAASTATKEVATKEQFITNSENIGKAVVNAVTQVKLILVGSGGRPELLAAFHATNVAVAALLASSKSGASEVIMLDNASDSINASLAKATALKIAPVDARAVTDPRSLDELAKLVLAANTNVASASATLLTKNNDADLAVAAKNLASNLDELTTLVVAIYPKLGDSKEAKEIRDNLCEVALDSSKLVVLAKQSTKDPLVKSNMTGVQKDLAKHGKEIDGAVKSALKDHERNQKKYNDDVAALKKVMEKAPKPKEGANAQDLKTAAKDVVVAVSQLSAATNDKDALKASASLPALMQELYAVSLAVPVTAGQEPLQAEFVTATKATGASVIALLEKNATLPARNEGNVNDNQTILLPQRNQVQKSVTDLIDLLGKLPVEKKPNTGNLNELVVDPNDIEAFAENELLKCAQAIKDAAAMLIKAAPAKKSASVGLDVADINEAILEAARAIAAATGGLIECAAVSQSERKEEAKSGASKYNADPAWANGLVSAAQSVAANVKNLVEAANQSASGKSDEERLVACARAVATTTIHLVTASRTKGDPAANSQRNLSKASVNVTHATQQLVVAANAAAALAEEEDDEDFTKLNFQAASGIRAQMEQRGRIDKLEKELREKRQELLQIRRARYQKGDKDS